MKKYQTLLIFLLFVSSISYACMSKKGAEIWSKEKIQKKFSSLKRKPSAAVIKFADGHAKPSLESQLGNLLLQLKETYPLGFVASLPASLERSTYFPFGDKQSNAKMNFANWKQSGFPVVGVQFKNLEGKLERKYDFHPSFNITSYKEIDLGNNWFKVQPKGWLDSFYFSYDSAVMPIKQFTDEIPAKLRTYPGNRVAPNPGSVPKGASFEKVMSMDLGVGYNAQPWPDNSVHGFFPTKEGARTALGGVLTRGIVKPEQGPFKHLYTCFERRNVGDEKSTGLPSGAGWHHIGNAGETLLNNIESLPIPVATGRTHNNSDSAFALTESVTATWLNSDEALVNVRNTFHWYLNPYEASVCTEIWVHNCLPDLNNNWGFNCPWIE